MEASRAFQQGKPMLDDAAYDELKRQLRIDRSPVVAQVLSCLAVVLVCHQPLGPSPRIDSIVGWNRLDQSSD